MAVLAEIVGVSKAVTRDSDAEIQNTYRNMTRSQAAGFHGFHKSYTPLAEGDIELPDETRQVQFVATEVLSRVQELLTRTWNVNRTREEGNTLARADLLNPDTGEVLLPEVPVGHLIFLEKQFTLLRDLIVGIPTHPLGTQWQPTDRDGLYVSPETTRQRHGKEVRYKTSAATDRHPEQLLDKVSVDVPVGTWHDKVYTGALPHKTRRLLHERISALIEAVKSARIKANATPITDNTTEGQAIWAFLLDGTDLAG